MTRTPPPLPDTRTIVVAHFFHRLDVQLGAGPEAGDPLRMGLVLLFLLTLALFYYLSPTPYPLFVFGVAAGLLLLFMAAAASKRFAALEEAARRALPAHEAFPELAFWQPGDTVRIAEHFSGASVRATHRFEGAFEAVEPDATLHLRTTGDQYGERVSFDLHALDPDLVLNEDLARRRRVAKEARVSARLEALDYPRFLQTLRREIERLEREDGASADPVPP